MQKGQEKASRPRQHAKHLVGASPALAHGEGAPRTERNGLLDPGDCQADRKEDGGNWQEVCLKGALRRAIKVGAREFEIDAHHCIQISGAEPGYIVPRLGARVASPVLAGCRF